MTDQFQPAPDAKGKKKKWPWIVGAVAAVVVIGAVAAGGGEDEKEADKTASSGGTSETEAAVEAVAEAPAAPAAEEAAATTIPPLKAAAPSGKGKTVTYEVISDSATLNNVTWFDENSEMQQDTSAAAPWSLTVDNTSTVVMAGVTAQTDGTSVTCRVTVDGEVEDEQTATGKYAVVNCTASVF